MFSGHQGSVYSRLAEPNALACWYEYCFSVKQVTSASAKQRETLLILKAPNYFHIKTQKKQCKTILTLKVLIFLMKIMETKGFFFNLKSS